MKVEFTYLNKRKFGMWICHIIPTLRCLSDKYENYFEIYFAWLFWRVTLKNNN